MEYILLIITAALGLWLLNYNKEWLFALCIFSIPLSVGIELAGGASISFPGEVLLAILAVFVLGQLFSKPDQFKKIVLHPISLLVLAEFVWMLITALFSDLPMVSFKRVVMRGIFIASLFLFTIQLAEKDKNKINYLFLYALGLIIPIGYSEFRHYWSGMDFLANVELCKPFFSEHTIYGAAIAFVIPLVAVAAGNRKEFGFSKTQGFGVTVFLILLLIAEYFAFSRAGLISLVVSLLMFVILKLKIKFKHLLVGLSCVIILAFAFRGKIFEKAKTNSYQSTSQYIGEHLFSVGNLSTNVSNLERINRWKCALRMFSERPFTGFGPGTFQFVYGPFQKPAEMTRISTTKGDKGNAHSELFTSLSETGLPGLVLNLLTIFTTLGIGMRACYNSQNTIVKKVGMAALLGFVTFVIHGLFNTFLDQDKIAGLVFSSMAIIVAADLANQKKITNR